MKSKHFANGKKIAICDFRDYHTSDNFDGVENVV